MYYILVIYILARIPAMSVLDIRFSTQTECELAGRAWGANKADSTTFSYNCLLVTRP